jgi:adenylate cyclase
VEQVAALYDPERHFLHAAVFGQDPGVMCKSYGAVALWLLGYPDTARQQCGRALEMSLGLSPTTQAVAPHFAAMVNQLCGNHARAGEFADRAIAVSREHGLSFWMAGGTVLCGWALAAAGQYEEGLAKLRQGLADWHMTGSVTYETYYLGLLADVLTAMQQFDEARQVLDEALALVERTEERFFEPELYRLRGMVLLAKGADADLASLRPARDDLVRARDLAVQQKTRSLELRAALSLYELARRSGSTMEERARLAEVYSAFTEGFQTPDLTAAEILLEGAAD